MQKIGTAWRIRWDNDDDKDEDNDDDDDDGDGDDDDDISAFAIICPWYQFHLFGVFIVL